MTILYTMSVVFLGVLVLLVAGYGVWQTFQKPSEKDEHDPYGEQ